MSAQISAGDLADREHTAPTSSLPIPRLSFVADLVCPWCYLGFARLCRLSTSIPALHCALHAQM